MLNDTAIKVEGVSKTFKLPHEKNSSIKSAIINFHKHKKGYEKQQVLNDISFEIKKGEFFGIVGRNGSGKSTLLKLLAGIYSPDKGSVQIDGKLTPFIELGVGFSPELSGRENVFLNGALLGFNRKEMEAMYDEIVAFAELGRFMDQKLKNYSSGMQVRLAFSIAIQAKSDILLLDEVLAVGDAAFQQKCFNYFEELKRRKQTVVFVSHDMSAVRRFCNKAVYIKDGLLTHVGSALEISDIYIAENIDNSEDSKDDQSKTSDNYKISAKITKQTSENLMYKIDYRSTESQDMFIGISVLWEGRSIAEITTSLDKPLKQSGIVTYNLDLRHLNAGAYRVDAALFTLKDRELVAINSVKNNFQVKGEDITKGAALKITDTWKYS